MSVSKAAGPGLQTECSQNYPNGISFGDLAATDGHGLKCRKVYHVSIPSWDSEVADAETVGKSSKSSYGLAGKKLVNKERVPGS